MRARLLKALINWYPPYIGAGIRLPLTWFSDTYHDDLRNAMRQAGIL